MNHFQQLFMSVLEYLHARDQVEFHDLKTLLSNTNPNLSPYALKAFLASLDPLYVELDPGYKTLETLEAHGETVDLDQVPVAGRIREFGIAWLDHYRQMSAKILQPG